MLSLYLNKKSIRKHLVTDIDKAFEQRNDMWFYAKFNNDIARTMDCVELLPPKKIAHPVFGDVGVDFLSKYVKLFMLLNEKPDAVYRLSDVHEEFADTLLELSTTHNIHLLWDCVFPFSEEQVACLPEYGVKLQGELSLRTAYNTYLRNPAHLKSLLCFNIPKGEHVYV